MVTLHEIAVLGDDIGGGAAFVDEFRLDLGAAEPGFVVGRRYFAGIEFINQEFGGVVIRDAERRGRRSGEEGDKADLDGGFVGARAAGRQGRQAERQAGGENKQRTTGSTASMAAHDWALLAMANSGCGSKRDIVRGFNRFWSNATARRRQAAR